MAVEARSIQQLKQDSVREAVCEHAARLFLENGFEGTTIDALAKAAGIGRRTFFRYFESKEAVVLWRFEQFGQRVAELIALRPAGEKALFTLERALIEAAEFYNAQPAQTLAVLRLTEATPALRGPNLEQQERWKQLFADALVQRKVRGESRLVCELTAAVGLATMTLAVRHWLDAPDTNLTHVVRKCFTSLGKVLGG